MQLCGKTKLRALSHLSKDVISYLYEEEFIKKCCVNVFINIERTFVDDK